MTFQEKLRRWIKLLVGGDPNPQKPLPTYPSDDVYRDKALSIQVQSAESAHRVAQKAIRDGNGRVIALLQSAISERFHGTH